MSNDVRDYNNVLSDEILEAQHQIEQLKQQLDESFTEEDVNGLIEDRDKTIKFLQKELAEKEKEIECWKDKTKNKILNMITTDFVKMCLSCGVMIDVKQTQTQLAIQELEKVKIELKNKICMVKNEEHCYSQRFISWYEMCNQINKQIKELKGE